MPQTETFAKVVIPRVLIASRTPWGTVAVYGVTWLASFYGMEGMADEAIEWVRLAIWLGNENYPLFAQSRKLDSLRSDPRFAEMMDDLRQHYEARQKAQPEATT